VWTGFSFVFAQGKPEMLAKAKKWLMWAFVSTLVIFLLQGFLVAVQGTVMKILPGTSSQVAPSYTVTQTIKDGAPGSSCTTDAGASGIMGVNNVCQVGRGAGSSNTTTFCEYRVAGTLCTPPGSTLSGVCRAGGSGTNECVTAKAKDMCIDSSGKTGSIDQFGSCVPNFKAGDPCITSAGQNGTIDQFTNCVFGTSNGRVAPQDGQDGSSCLNNGVYGMMAGGVCVVGGRR
jgi:hypothetical protein